MLLGTHWYHGKDVSALLLLIHPAQVTTAPLFGKADVQFLKEKWPFSRYAFEYQPKGKQVLGFDAAWYLVGLWKRCISLVVANPSCTSHHFTPFWRGQRTIFGREMSVSAV